MQLAEKKTEEGRVPPHSTQAEQSLLGAVMVNNDAVNALMEHLSPDDFYFSSHQVIAAAMIALTSKNQPIDAITLNDELTKSSSLDSIGGPEYLSYLLDQVPTAANAVYYANIIKDASLRRRMIKEASKVVEDAFEYTGSTEEFLDNVESQILSVAESGQKKSFFQVSELVQDSIREIEQRYISKETITGIGTGFKDLDHLTSGFQRSDLIILAGRPSMGKTALALSIAKNVGMESGKGVAVFSLEMPKTQIVTRLLCQEAKVSSERVRSGKLAESDFPRLVESASKLSNAPIFIDDTAAVGVLEMRAKARRLHREHGLSMVIVDYLQLMRGSQRRRNEAREQEIAEISGALKALAKELNVPVVALSQLNRGVENRTDKRPLMADLRESGAIEQDADLIGFVYRDEVYNPETSDKGTAELIVSKHRNGRIGTVKLAFVGEFTVFEDLSEREFDYLGSDFSFSEEDDDIL